MASWSDDQVVGLCQRMMVTDDDNNEHRLGQRADSAWEQLRDSTLFDVHRADDVVIFMKLTNALGWFLNMTCGGEQDIANKV